MSDTVQSVESEDELTISEAAAYLGCSERTVQRLTKDGKLTPTQRFDKAKKQVVNIYGRAKLDAHRVRRDNPQPPLRSQVLTGTDEEQKGALVDIQSDQQQALAATAFDSLILRIAAAAAHEAVREAGRQLPPEQSSPPVASSKPFVAIADKVLLTVEEARQLSGLSRDFIRTAISLGELKAQRIGRASRIKRTDFDAWIEGL